MKSYLFRTLSTALITCLVAAAAHAAGPSGTWEWTIKTPNGREIESTLTLKVDGDKLTGTLASGRQQRETEIANGKVKGDEISFEVTRERQGNEFTVKYSGKVEGDTIKGKMTGTRPGGGEGRERDWEAKRKA